MKKVLVIGDVIDDIVVRPLGLIRTDTDTKSEIQITSGGSAANFACWLASFGVSVTLYSRVHQKDVARFEAELSNFKVETALQGDPEVPTGAIVILVEGQTRTFLTQRGANQNLDLAPAIEMVKDFDLVYISGYSIVGSSQPQLVARLIERAAELGVPVACDPGSAGFISDFGVQNFLNLTAGIDYLLPSLEEGKVLSGEDRAEVIAEFLLQHYKSVVITQGAAGASYASSDEFIRTEAMAADLLDATGAGDAFAAGFLSSVLHGKRAEEALTAGTRAGAIAVTLVGGRPSLAKN
jgi:sugar/nucleoside kinase (ribokinase family)